MAKNESVEFFLRFLRERFNAFRQALTLFLQMLALDDRTKKVETAKAVVARLDDLKRAMSTKDHPGWIATLEQKLQWYVKAVAAQPEAGLQVIQTILSVNSEIEKQTWDFAGSSANVAIDFAAIYQEYYRESRVPELFDELVKQLQEIVDSGEIDSLQAIKALEKLIVTIKRNARGDFFSTRGAWEFTQLFFKNYGLELLENAPGLKHVVKAVRKTMSELDLEFAQVHDQIRKRLTDVSKSDLPILQYKPLALPAPKDKPEDA
jgi:hypothetical protein